MNNDERDGIAEALLRLGTWLVQINQNRLKVSPACGKASFRKSYHFPYRFCGKRPFLSIPVSLLAR